MADAQATRRGGSLGFVVGLVIGVPATIFALSNLESVQVEFAGWTASTPLWVVIILSLLAGALIGCAVLLAWQARRRRTRKKAARGRQGDSAPEPPATPDTAEPARSSEPAPSRRAGKPERPAASGSGSAADQS